MKTDLTSDVGTAAFTSTSKSFKVGIFLLTFLGAWATKQEKYKTSQIQAIIQCNQKNLRKIESLLTSLIRISTSFFIQIRDQYNLIVIVL